MLPPARAPISGIAAARASFAVTPATTVRAAVPPDPCIGHRPPQSVALPRRVTLGDFWSALTDQISKLDASELRSTYLALAERHSIDPRTPGLWDDFVRLWVAFEATRDGGWWRIRWDITNQEPSSVRIWKAWIRSPPDQSFGTPTAVAECDEITALFAVIARRLGVRGIGLFYPTWNHTIAAWALPAPSEHAPFTVVLVPTTQIFQGCPATLDRTTFTPPKHVYEFPRYDVRDTTEIPVALASFLLEQVRAYGEASPDLLDLIRAKRADVLQSSGTGCAEFRRALVVALAPRLTCGDVRALEHLARSELGQAPADARATLSWLGAP